MNYTSGRPTTFGKDQQVYNWNGTQHCVHCHQITVNGKCPQDCHRQILPTPKEQNQVWATLEFDEQGIRYCDDCHEVIRGGQDKFTRFEYSDGRIAEVVCSSCSAVRLNEKIAAGQDPGYQAIEAAIEAGEAFQCIQCQRTFDIAELAKDDQGLDLQICTYCKEQIDSLLVKNSESDWLLEEPPDSEGPAAWHTYRIWDNGIGQSVDVHEATNDDLDTGYPSRSAAWTTRFDDLDEALQHTGKSRQGISCTVKVYLNGKKI